MPFINGRFYMNPAYGRAVEQARAAQTTSTQHGPQPQDPNAHWVTMDGRHVLIQKMQAGRPRQLSPRDKAYLDKYYDAVATLAKEYNVDPALVLGVGAESGFAFKGTYLKTGDAFGMTGGSTKHMTRAASPAENVQQFFDNYGNQIRGTGSDASAFINALQGRDAFGGQVKGWKVYNSYRPAAWEQMTQDGIHQMQRDIPIYVSQRKR
jgi:hypothetical protein